MKTLAWVLVILNQSEVITDGELLYPSLQKCEMYEKKLIDHYRRYNDTPILRIADQR